MLRSLWSRTVRRGAAAGFQARYASNSAVESFLVGTNGAYVEDMFEAYKEDPSSVHVSWRSFFKSLEKDGQSSVTLPRDVLSGVTSGAGGGGGGGGSVGGGSGVAEDYMKILLLNRAFQIRGHYLAQLDPLGLYRSNLNMDEAHEQEYWEKFLSPATYGFSTADLDREFSLKSDFAASQSGLLKITREKPMSLRDIMSALKKAYCGTVGIEFMHITDVKQQAWIRDKFEIHHLHQTSKADKKILLDRLTWATIFEQFLAVKKTAVKRFGLEGAENLIPGLKTIIDKTVELGVQNIVIGMPHRGRLNVLGNVMRKPMSTILHEFHGGGARFDPEGSGDVKYHLGASVHRPTYSGKTVHMQLCPNPSHLEAVNPIVEGSVRAKQFYLNDADRKACMGIQLHGDAAFAGQGVVFETMELSDLHNYTTGGTIHVVCNNQVGFTTDPHQSRSSAYCSDVAKAIGAPIFHVNGDDAEAVVFVCSAAAEFRQTFGKSVVVDIVCYRKHGHNEADEPSFTQPKLYAKIRAHETALKIYQKRLISEGVVTEDECKAMEDNVLQEYEAALKQAEDASFKPEPESPNPHWRVISANENTSISADTVKMIGKALFAIPEGFKLHKLLAMQHKSSKWRETGEGLNWATGEALAFGSLLVEGHHVRLSGQDVERGTFSQRHAVFIDQSTEERYVPLNHIADRQAQLEATNSSLSEYAVLGFELGYAMENPNSLVLWEAQFGDFVNGAQIMIDQFISSMEQKWGKQSNLVLLLPHGFEGQGPEHSSARLERFLIQCDDDPTTLPAMQQNSKGEWELKPLDQIHAGNWIVCNPSTPANYFHLLRRQIHTGRAFRKPLVVMTPKALLRLPACVSSVADFTEGTSFQRGIPEVNQKIANAPEKVEKLVFCTGKVYYDAAAHRVITAKEKDSEGKEKSVVVGEHEHVALVRIEQISPFPYDFVRSQAEKYKNAKIVWLQEEPRNMGAWSYIEPRIELALSGKRASYIGRKSAASPATGLKDQHESEIAAMMKKTFE